MTRNVRAIRHEDGHLKLLDPIELPRNTVFTIAFDLPEATEPSAERRGLPVRDLGPMKGSVSRDEIYGDLF
jgi:hypothetical protein